MAALIPGVTIADGHFSTAQLANAGGEWLIAANDTGDAVLRYDGISWVQLIAGYVPPSDSRGLLEFIFPPRTPRLALGITQVWKYRRRLFFIQGGTMNAWYGDIDAVAGDLKLIPLSGSFTKGGSLLFGCAWSVSAGDGIDDKCIFVTTEGEIAIFTGTNPGDFQNWKQQGRYQMAKPMGKNSWVNIGGDVLIITVDGIVPISQALVKDIAALEFSALTRIIHPLWKEEILDKNDRFWSMCKWDEFGGLFVTLPGGFEGDWRCFVANTVTGAWCRFTGWDALHFCTLSGNMFFGTQDGRVVQADVKGKDYSADRPPTPIEEGYWRLIRCVVTAAPTSAAGKCSAVPPFVFTFRQARVAFSTRSGIQFIPQVTACVNYTSACCRHCPCPVRTSARPRCGTRACGVRTARSCRRIRLRCRRRSPAPRAGTSPAPRQARFARRGGCRSGRRACRTPRSCRCRCSRKSGLTSKCWA